MKTLESILIIIVAFFLVITIYKVETMPQGEKCIDMKCTTCNTKYNCNNYNYFEKMRYVWNLY